MKYLSQISKLLTFLTLLLVGISTSAQSNPQGSLQDISFLDGRWLGTYNGGPIEAAWTAPAGNNIVGYIRMIKNEQPALYEIFAFENTDHGPVARVKHFKKGLISLEEKEDADTYHFIEKKKNQALFEIKDKSVRIIYELRSKNQLVIQKGSFVDNEWKFIDLFIFKRIR
jgi:hypothetical protein